MTLIPRRPAVFLDRDGVINAMVWNEQEHTLDSPLRAEEVRLLPRAGEAIRRLKEAGWTVVIVSNQPVVAKRKTTLEELDRITTTMVEEVERAGGGVDGVYYCLHHPDAAVDELRGPCDCRKLAPGLLRRAAAAMQLDPPSSYMVGDRLTDVQAGRNAGCTTVLVTCPDPPEQHSAPAALDAKSVPHYAAADVYDAVSWILSRHAG